MPTAARSPALAQWKGGGWSSSSSSGGDSGGDSGGGSSSSTDDELLEADPLHLRGREGGRGGGGRGGGGERARPSFEFSSKSKSKSTSASHSDSDSVSDPGSCATSGAAHLAAARRRVAGALVPRSVASPSELRWYRDGCRHRPVRVCQPDEAIGLLSGADTGAGAGGGTSGGGGGGGTELVQLIDFPSFGARVAVPRKNLLPRDGAGGTGEGGVGWCGRLVRRYRERLGRELAREARAGRRGGFGAERAEMDALVRRGVHERCLYLDKILRVARERDGEREREREREDRNGDEGGGSNANGGRGRGRGGTIKDGGGKIDPGSGSDSTSDSGPDSGSDSDGDGGPGRGGGRRRVSAGGVGGPALDGGRPIGPPGGSRPAAVRFGGAMGSVEAPPLRWEGVGPSAAAGGTEEGPEEDLEEPYAQALAVYGDSASESDGPSYRDRAGTGEKSGEPLRPGDVLEYSSQIYVAGDRRGRRVATVLSVDPERDPILVLDNAEYLPPDTAVRRIRIVVGGRLEDHAGVYRAIELFRLVRAHGAAGSGASAGLAKEVRRVGDIVDRNIAKLQARARADGFAPMDVMNRWGRGREPATASDGPIRRNSTGSQVVPMERSGSRWIGASASTTMGRRSRRGRKSAIGISRSTLTGPAASDSDSDDSLLCHGSRTKSAPASVPAKAATWYSSDSDFEAVSPRGGGRKVKKTHRSKIARKKLGSARRNSSASSTTPSSSSKRSRTSPTDVLSFSSSSEDDDFVSKKQKKEKKAIVVRDKTPPRRLASKKMDDSCSRTKEKAKKTPNGSIKSPIIDLTTQRIQKALNGSGSSRKAMALQKPPLNVFTISRRK